MIKTRHALKHRRNPLELAKLVGDVATDEVKNGDNVGPTADDIRRVMSALGKKGGKKGGKARAEKLSKTRRAEIAKKAALARWSKLANE